MEITSRVISEEWEGREWGVLQEIRSINGRYKIDFQEVQEAQSPKEVGPKEEHTKTYYN